MRKAKINFNQNGFGLFMETLPAISAVFRLGFIPYREEIQEFTEEYYAAHASKTGDPQRPLYTIVPEEEGLGDDSTVQVMLPSHLPAIYKGIEFFKQYAQSHKLPANDRQQIFNHAVEHAPNALKIDSPYYVEEKDKDEDDVFNQLMAFLAAGLDSEDGAGNTFSKAFVPAHAGNAPKEVMTYEAFKAYILQALSKIFNDENNQVEASISLQKTEEKQEAVHVVGTKGGTQWSNGVLLQPFYEAYTLGKPLGETVLDMVKAIEETEDWISKVDMGKLDAFETAKDALMVRLLNYAQHKEALEGQIYKIVGDVAVVAYMLANQGGATMASYKVSLAMIEDWGVSAEYVLDYACANSARLFRPYLIPIEMFNFTKDMAHTIPDGERFFMEENFQLPSTGNGIYTLFQENGMNDPSVVFYKGALAKIADLVDDDLYVIIPESHVAILHSKRKCSRKQLRKIMKKMENDPFRVDTLSEKIFLYARADDTLAVEFE